MRVLCVGRHEYLSEHLCGYFRELGAQCEPAVGLERALVIARSFEPHLAVADSELLTASALETWTRDGALREVPLLAVSLTLRPEECASARVSGVAGVIYLPALDRDGALALLRSVPRPQGMLPPDGVTIDTMRPRAAAY